MFCFVVRGERERERGRARAARPLLCILYLLFLIFQFYLWRGGLEWAKYIRHIHWLALLSTFVCICIRYSSV